MKLLDKIWSMLGLVESDETEEAQKSPADKPAVRSDRKNERLSKPTTEEAKPRWNPQSESATPASPPALPARTQPAISNEQEASGNKGKVVITQPMGFDDARQIAENVTNGKTVVVNFERTDGETTKRTVDFMSGITYAVGGTVQRISSTIFMFAPAQVEVFASERVTDAEQGMLHWRRS
ncbi:MAG: cell division protein SepF [Negativicutes bacterium]